MKKTNEIDSNECIQTPDSTEPTKQVDIAENRAETPDSGTEIPKSELGTAPPYTRKAPTEPGYYWVRGVKPGKRKRTTDLVHIYMNKRVLTMRSYGLVLPYPLPRVIDKSYSLKLEWSGPIPAPTSEVGQ